MSQELVIGNLIFLSPLALVFLSVNVFEDGSGSLGLIVLVCYFSILFLTATIVSRLLSRLLQWRYSALLAWPLWFCLLLLTVGCFARISAYVLYGNNENLFQEEIYFVRTNIPQFACVLMAIGIVVNPVWLGGRKG